MMKSQPAEFHYTAYFMIINRTNNYMNGAPNEAFLQFPIPLYISIENLINYIWKQPDTSMHACQDKSQKALDWEEFHF